MEAEQSGWELFFQLIILDGSNGRTATLDRIDPKVLRVKSWDMKQFSLVSKLNFSFYENSDTLTQKTEIFKSLFCKFSLLWAIVIKKIMLKWLIVNWFELTEQLIRLWNHQQRIWNSSLSVWCPSFLQLRCNAFLYASNSTQSCQV